MKPMPLPIDVIDRIFRRFHGRFGNRFLEQFTTKNTENGKDVGVENAKKTWAYELRGLTPERIKKGLEHNYGYLPSCDSFKAACIPTPACHRESDLVRLPPAKSSKEAVNKGLQDIRNVLGMGVKS